MADHLGLPSYAAWMAIAYGLRIPMRGAAVLSHDGWRVNEETGATPDPLLGLFPGNFALSARKEAATLAFYLGLADDYIGSPMLSGLYGSWAAMAGDRDIALRLLDEGYGQFCVGRFLQTLDIAPIAFRNSPRPGPFSPISAVSSRACCSVSVASDPTARTREPGRPDRSSCLGAGRAIEVERLWIRQKPKRLLARHGAAGAELVA